MSNIAQQGLVAGFQPVAGSGLSSLTPEQLEKASSMLRAIAHPVRIAILNLLDGGKKLTVTEIHEQLGLEQSTTSHHLGILKDKGVLSAKREGKNTYYFIRHENLLGIIECISKCACF
ncbi:MAG: helix-turn-helix transcriptional regulator [Candidatus Methanofastidiosa archaeon]|nr:helix-turn-helix transcriptional regulator [Candidatus Methanofastidiosa archaeon]